MPESQGITTIENRELVRANGLPHSALVVVGTDHGLADPEPLKAIQDTGERAFHGGQGDRKE